MISIINAARRSLLSTTLKFTTLLSLTLVLASPQAFATSDWQFEKSSKNQSSKSNFEWSSLQNKHQWFEPDQKKNIHSAIQLLISKIDFRNINEIFLELKQPKDIDRGRWIPGSYSPTIPSMHHRNDEWFISKHGHIRPDHDRGHKHHRNCGHNVPEVPIPAAAWLFMSAMGGLLTFRRFGKNVQADRA